MNAAEYLLGSEKSNSLALLTLSEQSTFADLRAQSLTIANYLRRNGGKKGQRALLIADSDSFWIAAYLGTMLAGLVSVPLPPALAEADLAYILRLTDPAFAFVGRRYLAHCGGLLDRTHIASEHAVNSSYDGSESERALASGLQTGGSVPATSSDDLAALMFTSGSTGKPRGVMVSHGNIIANTDSIINYLQLTSADRIMSVLPFHYCFGASLLHTHLRAGGSIVVDSRFMYPEKVLQRMAETECTGFAGVPSHFQILLRKSNLARMSFPRLRYVQQAGGQLAPHFIRELHAALPGKQVFIMYGQTEATARLSCLPPNLLDKKLGSVGKGIPGVKLAVQNEHGIPVLPGETGEIVAEGANVTLGYWRDQEETARHFRHGRLYTGDLATVDEDGFIYIVDRAKDFLKCGGTRISCRTIENILLERRDVLEAAVIGIPDEVLGEAALAYLVPRERGACPNHEQLAGYCRQRMPLPAVPKDFIAISSLPKNSSGKVMKAELRERALAGQQR
jgi:acyl-CoA synthetase (AMP-forming)/AMP-acid ligase II